MEIWISRFSLEAQLTFPATYAKPVAAALFFYAKYKRQGTRYYYDGTSHKQSPKLTFLAGAFYASIIRYDTTALYIQNAFVLSIQFSILSYRYSHRKGTYLNTEG